MTGQDALARLDAIAAWEGPFDAAVRAGAQDALEDGRVLYFPNLSFVLAAEEKSLLTDALSNGQAKNISRDPDGRIKGERARARELPRLGAMMARFAQSARALVLGLCPGYAQSIEQARTSYRPVEIAGRTYRPRDDDKRLHVDAFPSRPQRGQRILRVFSNIHPAGRPRSWRLGEPFEAVARRYAAAARRPWPLEPWVFERLGVTRGRRSAYDYAMLGLHDGAKLDDAYQRECPQCAVDFPAGASWMCFTDQAMHAAMSGQFALEQTFHLPLTALARPQNSPLSILERVTGRTLL